MGMELGIAEMPLALFSTLAPMGAGAFLFLALTFFTSDFDKEKLKRIDQLTVIPIIFTIVGFICAFFHLASPQNAFGVFNHMGSPMSNEIVVGIIFCVVAIAYWLISMFASLSAGARKGLCCVVAIVGLIFAIFIGAAYNMDTISSWSSPIVPITTLFYALLGGCAVGAAVLSAAGVLATETKGFTSGATVLSWVAAIGSALFLCVHIGMVSGMGNNLMSGGDVVGQILPWVICAVVVLLLTGYGLMLEIKKTRPAYYAWIIVVVAFAGILIARLTFYATEISVGLSI